ncbi:methyltransferase domain-containing protein [Streptomyces sp. NPDC047097]|uniref:class I SAM-dependent methyltransferase n=1 Tax=Streptomyces sp. NPDC047097 TaxID=3155260 RepID=UPI0033C3DC8F
MILSVGPFVRAGIEESMGFIEPGQNSQEDVGRAYRSPAWWYDLRGGLFVLPCAYNTGPGYLVRFFGGNFGARHLELACGTGTFLAMVLRHRRRRGLPDPEIVGVDYAASMLEGAVDRFSSNPEIVIEKGDATDLRFDDESFDTVNVANALHCIPEVDKAMSEMFRVLKPGGTAATNVLLYPRGGRLRRRVAAAVDAWGIRKGILHTPYEKEDVRRRLVSAGFDVVREELSGNCYNILLRKNT